VAFERLERLEAKHDKADKRGSGDERHVENPDFIKPGRAKECRIAIHV
jgi:hypothetical protein